MTTILHFHDLAAEDSSSADLLDLITQEAQRCRDGGDRLGLGEWLVARAVVSEPDRQASIAEAIYSWSSPTGALDDSSISRLASLIASLDPSLVAASLVGVAIRAERAGLDIREDLADLSYRALDPLHRIYAATATSPRQALAEATARLLDAWQRIEGGISSFNASMPATARTIGAQIVKDMHALRPLCLPSERPLLGEIEGLLGSAFRHFVSAAEQNQSERIVILAAEVREHARVISQPLHGRANSLAWNRATRPIALRVIELADLARARTEAATVPSLRLDTGLVKVDLERSADAIIVTKVLRNVGYGRASSITVEFQTSPDVLVELIEPSSEFAIEGQSEERVRFRVMLEQARRSFDVRLTWRCRTLADRPHVDVETLRIEQQRTISDWSLLRRDPPYSLNPVRRADKLIGRDELLERLILNVDAGTSAILWGQKRVGKTSVAQALLNRLERQSHVRATLLRLGEVKALSEAEIGRRMLDGLSVNLFSPGWALPPLSSLGSGLGGIIPSADRLLSLHKEKRFLVVVDEFDDLAPYLYMGERGQFFMAALRSLSETGITFFFIGSERMRPIYARHQQTLNKWSEIHLDVIESHADRRNLVILPVGGAIEYEEAAVEEIAAVCGGSAFYTNVVCGELFQRCVLQERTFVSAMDVRSVVDERIGTLGESNFAHFWEDNPEIDEDPRESQAAENAIVLVAASALGGRVERSDEILEACEGLGLTSAEGVTAQEVTGALFRLKRRGVLREEAPGVFAVHPPILQRWLRQNAELALLPRWKTYASARADAPLSARKRTETEEPFPISEEQLLNVARGLVYAGKQKDVAEIRRWLRQFDDEVQMEVMFVLLQRLATSGFMGPGVKLVALERLEGAIKAMGKTGSTLFQEIHGKVANLCIAHVDSGLKSGVVVARELANRLRPAKKDHLGNMGDWIEGHAAKDSLVVIVDDFAGTGRTLVKGIGAAVGELPGKAWDRMLSEGRVACALLYSFPEARSRVSDAWPSMKVITSHVFGDEVRAFEEGAKLFETPEEMAFARDVANRFGKMLYPRWPLGMGGMAALVAFESSIPNNTLPIFWSTAEVGGKPWIPLFSRA